MTTPTRITEEARKLCNGVAKAFQDLDDLDTASAPVAQALLAAEQRGREIEREDAKTVKKAAQDYCWERYKGRDPLNLATPAVFTSHEWQKIGDYIDAAIRSRTTEG